MYIQPNSVIQIMRGVPLNPNYKDTIKFSSLEEQTNYFNNYVFRTFTQQYYQRANKNTCRLEVNAEQVYDCNYMHFRNSAFGQKNFYAFITNVEYINHNVTEITYEIDVLQTWAFDYTLGKCFVEREHGSTDVAGDNLLPEPVEIDDYICQSITPAGFNDLSYYLFVAEKSDGRSGATFDGIFCVNYYQFPSTEAGGLALDEKLRDIVGDWDDPKPGGINSIVGVFLGPTAFPPVYGATTPATIQRTVERPITLFGYVPNNKKLLTAPYLYLNVDCINDNKNYSFEYFWNNDGNAVFNCIGSSIGNASVIAVPVNYKSPNSIDYTQQVVMGGYPMCIYPVDSAKSWLSQNAVFHVLTGLGSLVTTGVGMATGNFALAAAGVGTTIANGAKMSMEMNRENTSRGSVSTNINAQNKSKDFYFKIMCVNPNKARSIDDFFSRYGYTCERVKVPNTRVRKRWTFTKTVGCVVNGNLPADDKATISKIFDNGITFWTTVGTVGDYVMDDNGII